MKKLFNKKVLVATALALILAMCGSTFAWFTSRTIEFGAHAQAKVLKLVVELNEPGNWEQDPATGTWFLSPDHTWEDMRFIEPTVFYDQWGDLCYSITNPLFWTVGGVDVTSTGCFFKLGPLDTKATTYATLENPDFDPLLPAGPGNEEYTDDKLVEAAFVYDFTTLPNGTADLKGTEDLTDPAVLTALGLDNFAQVISMTMSKDDSDPTLNMVPATYYIDYENGWEEAITFWAEWDYVASDFAMEAGEYKNLYVQMYAGTTLNLGYALKAPLNTWENNLPLEYTLPDSDDPWLPDQIGQADNRWQGAKFDFTFADDHFAVQNEDAAMRDLLGVVYAGATAVPGFVNVAAIPGVYYRWVDAPGNATVWDDPAGYWEPCLIGGLSVGGKTSSVEGIKDINNVDPITYTKFVLERMRAK